MCACVIMRWTFAVLALSCCQLMRCSPQVMLEETGSVDSVSGGVGGAVSLPCDVTPAQPPDSAQLVIWYKQGHHAPIYTWDSRGGAGAHWADPALGRRASFAADETTAKLTITALRAEDEGQYRCRVDFMQSPTNNARINLTVLTPPERLVIVDDSGVEVVDSSAGPYREGAKLSFTCRAINGRPVPRVSWWQAHSLRANSQAAASVELIATRHTHRGNLTCQAVTHPSMAPVSRTISIDVILPPLSVRIVSRHELTAGVATQVTCEVSGAYPSAAVTWWLGSTELTDHTETVSSDNNVTISILRLSVTADAEGRVLRCVAAHPALRKPMQDEVKLKVLYAPVVTLTLGRGLHADDIWEGADVYLECGVRSIPQHAQLYFTHRTVMVKAGGGVLLANQSLVLQKVSRKQAGAYQCVASNAVGTGRSDTLMLDVKYPPSCKSSQPTVIRAAKGDTVRLVCELDANPMDTVNYEWWFNNSAHSKLEVTPTPQQNYTAGVLEWVVQSAMAYGWIQCTGSSFTGSPCLFQLLPAIPPRGVSSCDVSDVTHHSLRVRCSARDHNATYTALIIDTASGEVVQNSSSASAEWSVSGLSPRGPLSIQVTAHNAAGSSQPFSLSASLLEPPSTQNVLGAARVQLSAALMTSLAATGAVIVILCAVLVAACFARNKKQKMKSRPADKTASDPLTSTECDSLHTSDKNPDIIPMDSATSDTWSSYTEHSSIRPLTSKSSVERYEQPVPPDKYYRNELCGQPTNIMPSIHGDVYSQHASLGPSMHCLQPASLQQTQQQFRQPANIIYEDWLRYRDAVPMMPLGLVPDTSTMRRTASSQVMTSPRPLHPSRPVHGAVHWRSLTPPVQFDAVGVDISGRVTSTLPRLVTRNQCESTFINQPEKTSQDPSVHPREQNSRLPS